MTQPSTDKSAELKKPSTPPFAKRTRATAGHAPKPRRPGAAAGSDAFARYERAMTAIMVGSSVRAARRKAGVSQAELAKRAGTSQPSIARLEQGRVSPTIISLDRIARALGAQLVVDFEPLSAPGER